MIQKRGQHNSKGGQHNPLNKSLPGSGSVLTQKLHYLFDRVLSSPCHNRRPSQKEIIDASNCVWPFIIVFLA